MRFKKVARIVLLTGLIFFLSLVSLQAFLNYYMRNHLQSALERKMNEKKKGELYELQLSEPAFNIFTRSFRAGSLRVLTRERADSAAVRFEFSAQDLSFERVRILKIWLASELDIGSVRLKRPSLKFYAGRNHQTGSSPALHELLPPPVRALLVRSIEIEDVELFYKWRGEQLLSSSRNMISVDDLRVSREISERGQLFQAADVRLDMKQFTYRLNRFYDLSGRNLNVMLRDSVIRVDSLRLVPQYSKKAFAREKGLQSSRVLLSAGELSLKHMDVSGFLADGAVNARKAVIRSLVVGVFLDKNVDFVAEEKPSLQRMIRNIPVPLRIDSVAVEGGTISYEHLAPGGTRPGRIWFSGVKASVRGLDNSDTLPKTGSKLFLEAASSFMSVSQLNLRYEFPLNTDKEEFFCSGSLAPMDLRVLNAILEPVTFVSVQRGRLDELSFSFRATEKASKGKMKFYYHDLNLETVKKENRFQPFRKLLFGLARALVLRRQNPGKNGTPGATDISYSRYPNKYFFYYTWKSVQSGMMQALGLSSEKLLQRSDAR